MIPGVSMVTPTAALVECSRRTGVMPFCWDGNPRWWWNREGDDAENWLLPEPEFPERSDDIQRYKKALRGDRCAYCGGEVQVLDHIQARARGGGDCWENLTGACTACNSRKQAKSLIGFLGADLVRPRIAAAEADLARWSKL